jgi:hypothetical protein
MSQENVEIVREADEAFERGDFDGFLSRTHPAIERPNQVAGPGEPGRERVANRSATWGETLRSTDVALPPETLAAGCQPRVREMMANLRVSGSSDRQALRRRRRFGGCADLPVLAGIWPAGPPIRWSPKTTRGDRADFAPGGPQADPDHR